MNSGGNYSYGTKSIWKACRWRRGNTLYYFQYEGMYAQITDFGASIVSLVVKDKDGKNTDVVWL